MKRTPKTYEKCYDAKLCEDIIKDNLEVMKQYGYDFMYSTTKPFDNEKKKFCSRKVKISVYCKKCDRKWTSIVGTIEVEFAH